MLPAAITVAGAMVLMQVPGQCTPDSLLEPAPSASQTDDTTTPLSEQIEPGRVLTPDELDELVANASDRDIVVVFMNPVPGPVGPEGPQGPTGPEGPVGPAGADAISGTPIVGEVRMWAGPHTMLPAGWLPCDGGVVSRTDFSSLYDILGTNYGPGDGSTTFNLPNYVDRSPMGAITGGAHDEPLSDVEGTLAPLGGEAMHTLTLDEMPTHAHDFSHTHTLEGVDKDVLGASVVHLVDSLVPTTTVMSGPSDPSITSSVGSGLPHNNVHPYFAITFMIYAGE